MEYADRLFLIFFQATVSGANRYISCGSPKLSTSIPIAIITAKKNDNQRVFARGYRMRPRMLVTIKGNWQRRAFLLISFRGGERSAVERRARDKDGEPLQEVTAGRRDSNISNSSGSGSSGGGDGGGGGSSGSTITITQLDIFSPSFLYVRAHRHAHTCAIRMKDARLHRRGRLHSSQES